MITLRKSIAITLAGGIGEGKTYQAEEAFNVCLWLEGRKVYPFRPALYIAVGSDQASAAGTADEMVNHPDCDFITAGSVDEAREAIDRIAAGKNGEPYRMVVFDSWSSLRDTAAAEIRDRAVDEADNGKSLKNQASKNIANNYRDIHRFAYGDVAGVVKHFQEAMAGEPRLYISTVHTKDRFIDDKNPRPPGLDLILQPEIARKVHAMSNVVWLLRRIDPDLSRIPQRDLASRIEKMKETGELDPRFVAYTKPGKWPEIGEVKFIKRQGATGPMSNFGREVPEYWEDPHLGAVLSAFIAESHGYRFAEDGTLVRG